MKKSNTHSIDGFFYDFAGLFKKGNILLVLSAFIILSCNKESEVFPLGQDYFPIEMSEYRIYEVTETTYVDKIETIENYQLRESFFDTIENGSETTYLMRVERRESSADIWESIENIAIRQTIRTLEYQKQNVTFVKMSYPVKAEREWDGNAQNAESEQLYHFEELGSGDWTFSDPAAFQQPIPHIKLIISDLPANIVEQDQRFEIYAQGIGLVERSFVEIDFCQQGCGTTNEREDGRILTQRLIEYGSE